MANKKYVSPSGREVDPGIFANLSKEGMAALQEMMNETNPPYKPKKKAVRKEKK